MSGPDFGVEHWFEYVLNRSFDSGMNWCSDFNSNCDLSCGLHYGLN